jgi:monoamine oxidase
MSKQARVAIVGGGIAGLYCAWRLRKAASNKFEITLFEAADRAGGRLKSVHVPGLSFSAELGAMRFKEGHHCLVSLIQRLGLWSQTTKFDIARQNIFHLRGHCLTGDELVAGSCQACHAPAPFRLRKDERGKDPSLLIIKAILQVLRQLTGVPKNLERLLRSPQLDIGNEQQFDMKPLTALDRAEWRAIKDHGRYHGHPLSDFGFWNIIQSGLSNEAVQLVHGMVSLESVLGNWNAAEAIPWFIHDFRDSNFLMLRSGLETIASVMCKSIKDRVDLKLDTPVSRLEQIKDGSWRLFSKDDESVFDSVILAVPQVALKTIKIYKNKSTSPWCPSWLDGVRPRRLLKLFLVYDQAWWDNSETKIRYFESGGANRIFTDLPLRQVYFFSPAWMKSRGYPPTNHKCDYGLVMASYSDEHFADFWGVPLRKTSNDKSLLRRPIGMPPDIWGQFQALEGQQSFISERAAQKVHKQLAEILGLDISRISEPICGFSMDWQDVGGGWHTWETGHQPWHYLKLHKPLKNLFVCGEAFSTEQGWIEGALRTAEQVLREAPYLLKRPDWGQLGMMTSDDFLTYINPA